MNAGLSAAGLAAAVALAVPSGRPRVDRLAVALSRLGPTRWSRWSRWQRYSGATAAAVVLLGPTGAILVLSAVIARVVWERDAPVRRLRRHVAEVRRAAPLAFDLLSTCVAVGLSLPVAARVVAMSVGVPLGPLLGSLAAVLERGESLDEASGALGSAGLADLRTTLLASESGGPGLATALSALAVEGRASAAAAAQTAAKRSGVWAVGPLTLCFLPAFVLVGVVPLVAGLLSAVGP